MTYFPARIQAGATLSLTSGGEVAGPFISALHFLGAKGSAAGVVSAAQAVPVAPVVSVAGSGRNSKKNT